MTTINLYQNQQEEKRKLPSRTIGRGFLFSLGIVIFTLLVFGGLKAADQIIVQKNKAIKNEIENENKKLSQVSNFEAIVDLQTRLEQIKNNLQVDKNNEILRLEMKDVLKNLEKTVLKDGIVVSSCKYEKGKMTVSFVSNSLNDIARQILNFKKSDYFANANLTGINKKETEEDIKCDMEMDIKN